MGLVYKVVALASPLSVFENRATYRSDELINAMLQEGGYCYALGFSQILRARSDYQVRVLPLIRAIQMAHRDKLMADPTHLNEAFRDLFKIDEHRSLIQPEAISEKDFESLLFVRFTPENSIPHTFALLKRCEPNRRYALFDSNDKRLEPYWKKTIDEVKDVFRNACVYFSEVGLFVNSVEKVCYIPRSRESF